MSQPWKRIEQRISARLQAVDGRWPHKWPPVTTTGRIGHLGPQQAPVHSDTLTHHHIGEVKSSGQKAKNPGHRITKEAIRKLLDDAKQLSEEHGTNIRPFYAIAIANSGATLYAIPEEWFFRYLVLWEDAVRVMTEMIGEDEETIEQRLIDGLDELIGLLINEFCSERYK